MTLPEFPGIGTAADKLTLEHIVRMRQFIEDDSLHPQLWECPFCHALMEVWKVQLHFGVIHAAENKA